MKKLFFLLVATSTLYAANSQQVLNRTLKKGITLQMPRTADDDMPGTRGASVAYNPVLKKYYASMAGNIGYPMGVFNITGAKISEDGLNTNVDTRGLWYNTVKKELQGNGYNETGWFSYKVNAKGLPEEPVMFLEGKYQPDDNSIGAFNAIKQQVLFLAGDEVYFYSMKGEDNGKPLTINWGRTKKDGVSAAGEEIWTSEDYNYTTLVYTGIKGAELGFLNINDAKIELYNIADGFLTQRLELPDDASINPSFNFSYTNGMFWLFNMEDRKWTSYK